MKSGKLTLLSNSFLLLLIAAAYALMSFWTPYGLDDWTFMAEWRDVNGDAGASPTACYNFWADIRLVDNGRLSNTLIPLFLLFSPWKELFPVITGCFVAFLIWGVARLSFPGRRISLLPLLLSWACVVFLLPWRNSLFIADYSINYIWSAAITMLFMLVVMRGEKKGWPPLLFALSLLLALIAGLWHEGFALATLGGFLLYTIFSRRRFAFQWWTVGIFYAGVTIVNFLCPGMLERADNEFGILGLGASLFTMIADFLPVILLALLIVGLSFSRSGRKRLRECRENPWFMIGIGIIVVGVLLSVLFVHQPRSAFWPDLMAIVLCIMLSEPLWSKVFSSSFRWYVGILLLSVALLPMIFAITEQYEYFKEAKTVEEKMEISPEGTVYHDLRSPSLATNLALRMPSHSLWATPYHYQALTNHTLKPFVAVVPTSFAENNWLDIAEPVKGDREFMRVGESIVLPFETDQKPEVVPLSVGLRSGVEVATAGMLLPFMSAEGIPYTYLQIYHVPVPEIASIKINP